MKNLSLSIVATSILLTIGTVTPSIAATQTNAVVQNQIDINRAINIAKHQNAQGQLKSIKFDADDSEYKVEFASSSTKYETTINSRNGSVKSTKKKRIEHEDAAEYKALNSSKIDLVKAMQIATRNAHGKLVEAEFNIENNKPIYEIKTVRNNQKYEVIVDANTGRIIHTERD